MKFDKVTPKEKWPKQKVYQRISQTKKDVAELNRKMNRLDGVVALALNTKESVKKRISNKNRYLKQLGEQLKEAV